jgi:hypothetical protein
MSSERLREAAQKIRETVAAATPGTWGVGNGSTVATEVEQMGRGSFSCRYTITDLDSGFNYGENPDDDGWRENGAQPEDDAALIALMASPPVALAVADLLDLIANTEPYLDDEHQAAVLADRILGPVTAPA